MGLTGGVEIGIYGLEEIFKEVRELGIDEDDALAEELMKRVKLQNWVPRENEAEVSKAIFDAYATFCTQAE